MATTFLEPGGDADFAIASTNGFWLSTGSAIATDFVHGAHIKSISHTSGAGHSVGTPVGAAADVGTRTSFYLYLVALPTSTHRIFTSGAGGTGRLDIRLTTAGVLQLSTSLGATQIGVNGSTLSTGVWYRISLAYTITSTTINRIELFKDGVSDISVTNATLSGTGTTRLFWGNLDSDATLDFRTSDHYADNSNSLTDTGDIWVTAKRPISNGTVNNFITQIGSGGSGIGTGHAPQVNERALSKTNGWSMVGAGSAVTEEYTVEGASVGDMDITGKTIIDWLGWISADALVGETASIIAGGASSTYTTPASPNTRMVTKIVGSTSYPTTGTDVGIISDTSLTTLNLYECGVLIAFIGPPVPPTPGISVVVNPTLLLMGAG